jgi:hypothetical protein
MTPSLRRSREKSENSDGTTAHGLVGVEDLADPAYLDRITPGSRAVMNRTTKFGKYRGRDQPRERPAPAKYSDRDTQYRLL